MAGKCGTGAESHTSYRQQEVEWDTGWYPQHRKPQKSNHTLTHVLQQDHIFSNKVTPNNDSPIDRQLFVCCWNLETKHLTLGHQATSDLNCPLWVGVSLWNFTGQTSLSALFSALSSTHHIIVYEHLVTFLAQISKPLHNPPRRHGHVCNNQYWLTGAEKSAVTKKRPAPLSWNFLGSVSIGSTHRRCSPEEGKAVPHDGSCTKRRKQAEHWRLSVSASWMWTQRDPLPDHNAPILSPP